MNNLLKKHKKIIIQIAILAAIAALFAIKGEKLGFYSSILGGLCWILPNLYFRLRMQKIMTSFDIQKMLNLFLMSQVLKLALSFGLIILVLLLITVDKKSFLVSYAVMIFTSFPMLMNKITPSQKGFYDERTK